MGNGKSTGRGEQITPATLDTITMFEKLSTKRIYVQHATYKLSHVKPDGDSISFSLGDFVRYDVDNRDRDEPEVTKYFSVAYSKWMAARDRTLLWGICPNGKMLLICDYVRVDRKEAPTA